MTSISVFKILKRSLQLEVILFLHNESSSFPSKTTGSNQSNYFYLSFAYHRSPSSWLQSAHLWLNSRYWVVYASLPLERPVFLLPRPLVTSSAQLLNKCFSPKSPITFGPLKGEAQQKSYRASSVNSELQRGRACTKHAGKEA